MLTLKRIGVALMLGLLLVMGSGCHDGWHRGGGGGHYGGGGGHYGGGGGHYGGGGGHHGGGH